jgi:YVTN family beta-propeller protein
MKKTSCCVASPAMRRQMWLKCQPLILFDVEKPESRDTIETIRTQAGMSKFIIADLTDATNAGSNSVSVISTATNTVVKTIPVGDDFPAHAGWSFFSSFGGDLILFMLPLLLTVLALM